MPFPQAAKKQLGITDQTFYRWRTRYGSLKEDEAKRLQILEQNARLKRIIAGARRGTTAVAGNALAEATLQEMGSDLEACGRAGDGNRTRVLSLGS
jgi:hypothetical protein